MVVQVIFLIAMPEATWASVSASYQARAFIHVVPAVCHFVLTPPVIGNVPPLAVDFRLRPTQMLIDIVISCFTGVAGNQSGETKAPDNALAVAPEPCLQKR